MQWLEGEKEGGNKGKKGGGGAIVGYKRSGQQGRLERESVLCKVKLKRANKGSTVSRDKMFLIKVVDYFKHVMY